MVALRIKTFGGLAIQYDEAGVVRFPTHKAEALLVYLASTRRPYPREMLADLLWEERSQSVALSNLRPILTSLRQQVAPYVSITRQTVAFNLDSAWWLDAVELQQRVLAASQQWTQL